MQKLLDSKPETARERNCRRIFSIAIAAALITITVLYTVVVTGFLGRGGSAETAIAARFDWVFGGYKHVATYKIGNCFADWCDLLDEEGRYSGQVLLVVAHRAKEVEVVAGRSGRQYARVTGYRSPIPLE